MELFENGLTAALVLILYTVVDKIIAPLIKGRSNGKHTPQPDRHDDCRRRIDRNENDIERNRSSIDALREDIHDVRVQVGTISGKIGVANAILERIEHRIE
mgnify:FL=1